MEVHVPSHVLRVEEIRVRDWTERGAWQCASTHDLSPLVNSMHDAGGCFTNGNPKGSCVWTFEPMLRLIEYLGASCTTAVLLSMLTWFTIAGAGFHCFCEKSTRLPGNIPTLKKLEQQ